MEKITKEKKMKKINKLLRIISKTFEVNGELLYQAYKYDSRFQNGNCFRFWSGCKKSMSAFKS
jgi:hypothetical protein